MKCIDAHVHIFEHFHGYCSLGEFRAIGNGRARWANGDEMQVFPEEFGDTGVTAEKMLEFMNEKGIEKAVLLQGSAYGFQNEYLSEVVTKYPGRFCATGIIDPFIVAYESVMNRFIDKFGFTAFKMEISLLAGLMGYHDHKTFLEHPNIEKLCSRLNDIGGTLAMDIGEPGSASHQVAKLRYFAQKYPNMKLVVCHLLSMPEDHEQLLKEELIQLNLPNVWYDLAAIANNTKEQHTFVWARKYLVAAKEIAGAEKLLWGSDVPITLINYPYELSQSVIIDSGVFNEEEISKIFYSNAMDVYKFK